MMDSSDGVNSSLIFVSPPDDDTLQRGAGLQGGGGEGDLPRLFLLQQCYIYRH